MRVFHGDDEHTFYVAADGSWIMNTFHRSCGWIESHAHINGKDPFSKAQSTSTVDYEYGRGE